MANHTGEQFFATFGSLNGIPSTPPENVFEQLSASEVAPGHRKRMSTATTLNNSLSSGPASATFWFAWRDTIDSPITHLSEPSHFDIPAGEQVTFQRQFIIPYTPPVVGVRIQNNGPGEPIYAGGGYNYQTIPIPEPDGVALAVAGAAGVAAASKRRRA